MIAKNYFSALTLTAVISIPMSSLAQDASLQPSEARITNSVIRADHDAYTATQGRIKALNDGGIRIDNYHLAKAQCWLDTSFHEYTRNDRGGYPQAALDESVRLIGALEQRQDPGFETPLVNNAVKLRPDLWAKYDSLKSHKGFTCATQATACAEVELVHAGNEMRDGGWRHANPYIQIAEDLLARAEKQVAECNTAAPPPVVTREERSLSADALFKFDRGDLAGMLPEGRAKIEALIRDLNEVYSEVRNVRIFGHTDRLGSDSYNQRLSEQRANTVRDLMIELGNTGIIATVGVGESQPTGGTSQCVGERATEALKACLQPDRRVELTIDGVKR